MFPLGVAAPEEWVNWRNISIAQSTGRGQAEGVVYAIAVNNSYA